MYMCHALADSAHLLEVELEACFVLRDDGFQVGVPSNDLHWAHSVDRFNLAHLKSTKQIVPTISLRHQISMWRMLVVLSHTCLVDNRPQAGILVQENLAYDMLVWQVLVPEVQVRDVTNSFKG